MRSRLALGLPALVLSAAMLSASAQTPYPMAGGPYLVTIKDLMEQTITPATNTIWGAYEPPSEEAQWKQLEEAAVTLLAAANLVALGGSGPMDDEWAKDPAWKAFNQIMIDAGVDALAAVRARDHDALLAAGDVLYPPCEGCHQQFNPAVIGEQ